MVIDREIKTLDTPITSNAQSPEEACRLSGGVWNFRTKECDRKEQAIDQTTAKTPEVKVPEPTPEYTTDAQGNVVQAPAKEPIVFESEFNKKQKEEAEQSNRAVSDLETFRTEEGRLGGLTIEGKSFLGLSPSDVQNLSQAELAKRGQPLGTQPVGTASREAREEIALNEAISQIGQIGSLTGTTQADINFGQALTAGGVKALPGLLGGLGTGILAGGLIGVKAGATIGAGAAPFTAGLSVPVVAAIGAGIGAAVGIVNGMMGNIKEQQRGELAAANDELAAARTNMRQLAMLASQDPSHADHYIKLYNIQLTRVHQSRKQVQSEVQGNLNSFMEDGREQLSDFDTFLQAGGIADIYGQKLRVSLNSDSPLSLLDFEEF